jgi:predicted dehydrogenase
VRGRRLGNLVKSIGIIGVSEGNGHPFSYSSIINGYSPEGLAASGWTGIYNYVRRRHASEFGLGDWKVTHAWTQDSDVTQRLCAACLIPHSVGDYHEFLGKVDAVVIARDDFENHFAMARPFLEAGLHVFVDKPLSLDVSELRNLKPYLEKGQLMSCSGMRYAREMDEPRADLAAYGRLKLIRGAIVLSWEKYGIHLLEAILSLSTARPVSVETLKADHASSVVRLEDGMVIQIDALGECARTFHVEIFGTQQNGTFDITDNFSMFRRMLWQFTESIRTGRPAIPPERTLELMRVLIAGRMSRDENREVFLHEITL